MQAPGRPDEDPSDGFEYGGWTAPYFTEADEASAEFMQRYNKPADLLLGRKTFEFFASYWPQHAEFWPGINEVTKYVLSTTLNQSPWQNSVFLNSREDLYQLKHSEGADIQVHGSGHLVQTLFGLDLIDALWLRIFPITLGKGKKLFADGTIPLAFRLTDSLITSNGVIFAHYERSGNIETGMVGV